MVWASGMWEIRGVEGRRYGRGAMTERRGEGEIGNGGKREKRNFGERWRGIGVRRGVLARKGNAKGRERILPEVE